MVHNSDVEEFESASEDGLLGLLDDGYEHEARIDLSDVSNVLLSPIAPYLASSERQYCAISSVEQQHPLAIRTADNVQHRTTSSVEQQYYPLAIKRLRTADDLQHRATSSYGQQQPWEIHGENTHTSKM